MRVIYKYTIEDFETNIRIKGFVTVLSAKVQNGKIVLYCMIVKDSQEDELNISIIGTGHSLTDKRVSDKKYLDTVIDDDGYVWHIFYKKI